MHKEGDMVDEILTVQEVADYLKVSRTRCGGGVLR
jgi:hypothetical protein